MIPFVGLTGGMGSGKSTALAALARLGASTLSTDAVVHELYGSTTVRSAVLARFGPDVVPDGLVDRSQVARLVFGDPAQRSWLEGLLWPLVGERMWSWRQELESLPVRPRAAVIEVPLLFESGMETGFDATISVIVDEAVREARASARGHAAVTERASRQLSQQEKAARSTYVVHNDGSEADLESKLSGVLDMLGV